jgi:hypothetical protein
VVVFEGTFFAKRTNLHGKDDHPKTEAAEDAFHTAQKSFRTAIAQERTAKKSRQSASDGVDGAHSQMRRHLDGIRWVGNEGPMHALGFVIDYADRMAPLDAAAAGTAFDQ